MSAVFETNLQKYMHPSTAQRLGFDGLSHLLPQSFWKKHALWEAFERDEYGNLVKHSLLHNLILDNGATLMLQAIYAGQAQNIPVFKYAALAQGTASTSTTSNLSTGAPITAISVAALPAGSSIVNGQTILLSSGSNSQTITAGASASAGATTVTVTSFTPNFAYPAGTQFIPQPQFTDNPTSLVGAVYALNTQGQYSYNGGNAVGATGYSGNGARSCAINLVTFNGNSTINGVFTELWICNTNPVSATGQVSNHLTMAPSNLANGGSLSYNFTERI